jgi:hypothetical protein
MFWSKNENLKQMTNSSVDIVSILTTKFELSQSIFEERNIGSSLTVLFNDKNMPLPLQMTSEQEAIVHSTNNCYFLICLLFPCR